MAKDKIRFVLNLKVNTEKWQEDILQTRFEVARQIYNAVLNISLKRYKEMIKTKRWRENQKAISDAYAKHKDDTTTLKKVTKPLFLIKSNILKDFDLSEYSLHAIVKPMQHHFKKNIDSATAQKIASRVWEAFNDNLFGDGENFSFKKFNQGLKSLEGKSNASGIRFKIDTNTLEWLGLKMSVKLDINNMYEVNALRNKICFCRLKRKFVRGKYKYVLQLVLEGVPPTKINKSTGKIKNIIGNGECGVDIGTQTVAYASDYDVKLLELAPNMQNIENIKRRILRKMDRSKRATNPQNFNKNGTIKKGIKLEWDFSNKYIKLRNQLKDIYRKQAEIRLQDHNIIANAVVRNCNTAFIETMNFKALQKRAKNTTTNSKGKINSKKRFGKSLANKAPAMFVEILNRKLKAQGGQLIEINTWLIKASQYNHLNFEYNKKKLSQRWNFFEYKSENIKVQRDLYSAFLLQNVNSDLCSVNNEKCNDKFEDFICLHNKEIDRLSVMKNLSSMGI